MLCVEVIAMTVIPVVAQSSPEYVSGVVAVATNSSTSADLGLFVPLNLLVGVGYLLGGLLFGIALFRAGILARWASALLAVAAVATAAIPLLPMVNQRLFAVPNGIAMIGLGWSLWREQRPRRPSPTATTPTHGSTRPAPGDRLPGRTPHPVRHGRPGGCRSRSSPSSWSRRRRALRLVELAGGPLLLPGNPRMTASPLPVVVHVVSAVPYAVLGAFQFSPVRRRHPRWHRATGRASWWLGLAVALSALWMTLFYARQPGTGELASSSGSPSGRAWPPASCSGSGRSAAATSPPTGPG